MGNLTTRIQRLEHELRLGKPPLFPIVVLQEGEDEEHLIAEELNRYNERNGTSHEGTEAEWIVFVPATQREPPYPDLH